MSANQIVHANTAALLQGLHASGADAGTVLTLADSKGVTQNLRLFSGTSATYEKDEAGNALLGIKLADGTVVARPFDQVPDAMTFAVEVAMSAKGHKRVGTHWVDTDTAAGAKAFELDNPRFKGLANNPAYTHGKAEKVYSENSSVGTSAKGTAASTFPDTLRIPIAGVVIAPKTPPKANASPAAKKTAKETAKETAKKTAKKTTPIVSLDKIKKKGPTGSNRVKATKRADIYAYVLAHYSNAQLKKVLALYGYKHPAPKKGGKQPGPGVVQAVLRDELRKIWQL